MNRNLHNAMMTQYAVRKVSGNRLVKWDSGVKCVIPSVKLYGAAAQDGTPAPDAPIMPVCDDGVFTSCGKNMFDMNGYVNAVSAKGARISIDNGEIIVGSQANQELYSKYDFGFMPNTQYTLRFRAKWNSGSDLASVYASFRNESGNSLGSARIRKMDGDAYYTLTSPVGTTISYFRIASWEYDGIVALSEIQLERGDTATPYVPYWDGGQAAAPELWAIPGTDIRDEWDTQTGHGVRRCGVIRSYAGEAVTTPYLSSTGELSEGATVIYGIPDTPFYCPPALLSQPNGPGHIIQVSGSVPDCPIEADYLTHS